MDNSVKKAAIITLGCKVNQYESEAIAERLAEYGFMICSPNERCDVYVINTCTVTAESERKSRQMIRRAIKKNPDARILVCGCLTQVETNSTRSIDGVDYITGNTHKLSVADMAIELIKAEKKPSSPTISVSDIATSKFEPMSITKFDRTRAYVKVQDGCENHCAYCIIPSSRGKVRSKPMSDVISEISALAKDGCKEVVITGIETGSYGKDLGTADLADLLLAIDEIDGIERIRTGSLDPSIMKEETVARLAKVKKLSPHFHLSLQSGSSKVLALMKRKYNANMALSAIERLRKAIPESMFTTDVITGFPGEEEQCFEETMEFMTRARFLDAHIFPYSEREGTVAATMDGKVPVNIRHERCSRLIEHQKKISESVIDEYLCSHKYDHVLFETYSNGIATGHTPSFIEVSVPSPNDIHSEIHKVKLICRKDLICIGELSDEDPQSI